MSEILLRPMKSLGDYAACAALQDEIWGYDAGDRMSEKVYLLAANIGGQLIGAFDGETLAGYALSLPGYRDGRAYLHSHHLGVKAAYRDRGVGRRLKLAQREDALARGIDRIEWTFDPLQIKNAWLNIARLGAIVRRYKRDFYGPSSSPLQGGLPTDRVIAEWWLTSEHVERALAGTTAAFDVEMRVTVPAEMDAWKKSATENGRARALQETNAAAFEDAFAQGLTVMGFERTAGGDGVYMLGRPSGGFMKDGR